MLIYGCVLHSWGRHLIGVLGRSEIIGRYGMPKDLSIGNKMENTISILIPTYNRAKALRAVWPSYFTSKHVKEIVVVNDGSTDNTRTVVNELIKKSPKPVKYIEHPLKMGQQCSRHTAINAATTEWILFGEDDVWLEKDYCETLLQEAIKLKADAIAGRLLTAYMPGDFSPKALHDTHTSPFHNVCDVKRLVSHFDASPENSVPAVFLHSIALIRHELFSVVNFDPWYKGNAHCEETDFYLSLNDLGYKVYFTPKARCFHLRGPISATGGQRINRVVFEYWHFVNVWHMLTKQWTYLVREHGFRGTVSFWMLKYFFMRQYAQILRLITGNAKSSFKGNTTGNVKQSSD